MSFIGVGLCMNLSGETIATLGAYLLMVTSYG